MNKFYGVLADLASPMAGWGGKNAAVSAFGGPARPVKPWPPDVPPKNNIRRPGGPIRIPPPP
jgi:hypothetical protein